MVDTAASGAERPKVFISYSRTDGSVLADELVPGLQLAGFDALLDKHDIEKGIDWEERLGALILKADTVVFIITPAAVRSERCKWEIDRTVELGKRLIPVQWIKVNENDVPERLRRLSYTIFGEGQSFARPLAELSNAREIASPSGCGAQNLNRDLTAFIAGPANVSELQQSVPWQAPCTQLTSD